MRALATLGVAALLTFALGAGTGIAVARHIDPLRQDAAPMEDWFRANDLGDAERMWRDTSLDYQTHIGGHDIFIADYKSNPSPTPPRIVFEASVPLANGEEVFYTVHFNDKERATLSVYVDEQGRFDGFVQ